MVRRKTARYQIEGPADEHFDEPEEKNEENTRRSSCFEHITSLVMVCLFFYMLERMVEISRGSQALTRGCLNSRNWSSCVERQFLVTSFCYGL